MLKVYSWPTSNTHKVHIMLGECSFKLGKDWKAIAGTLVRVTSSSLSFLAISPNNEIPALVDPIGPDGKPIALFELGAILL